MKIKKSLTKRIKKLERKIEWKEQLKTMRRRLTMPELIYLRCWLNCCGSAPALRHEEQVCAVEILQKARGMIDKITSRLNLINYVFRYYYWREEMNRGRALEGLPMLT